MAFTQPALPYAKDALAPYLSAEQIEFHYGKHHAAYFTNLNNLTAGKPEADKSLEDLILSGTGGIFNNAAQAWNHTFYWHCMAPGGGGAPTAALAAAIDRDFGSFDAFKESFNKAAVGVFGSGWCWLAKDAQGKLVIHPSQGPADLPMKHGLVAILTVDVWEHAYYIDYKNLRAKFVEGFWGAVNWQFANANFGG
ncbi:MAG: superoxide dismutase [Deltaproteobacteria bacterium]|nr:superoxide dismutase [Deltaproteobacteria bacterium]